MVSVPVFNRLIAERNPAYLQVSYHYDPAGRLLDRILSNRAKTSYQYDDDNRLTGLTNVSAGDKLAQSRTYTHDRVGNITTITDASGTTTFTYDALYRLTAADYPGTADDQAFTYDAVGNRLTHTTAAGTRHYIYNNPGNRLNEVRQGSTGGPIVYRYVYDDAGNRIEKRDSANLLLQSGTYDQKNRITTLDGGGPVLVFEYDPNDYRIAKDYGTGANQYLMEGEHYEAIYDGAGAIQAKFLRGVVVDEIVNGYYYDGQGKKINYTFHHDHLQSVTALTGHNGDTEQTVVYGPFGEQIGTSGTSPNVLGYTGRELDSETGLYYYRARYYDPEIGRFLNEDPLGFAAGDVNFYAYVSNNPVNGNDPSGLEWLAIYVKNGTTGIGKSTGNSGHVSVGLYPDSWDRTTHDASKVFGNYPNDDSIRPVPETKHPGYLPDTISHSFYVTPEQAANIGKMLTADHSWWLWGENCVDVATQALDIGNIHHPDFTNWAGVSLPANMYNWVDAHRKAEQSLIKFQNQWDSMMNNLQSNFGGRSANGGFVLYPNKANTNMMRQVYSK